MCNFNFAICTKTLISFSLYMFKYQWVVYKIQGKYKALLPLDIKKKKYKEILKILFIVKIIFVVLVVSLCNPPSFQTLSFPLRGSTLLAGLLPETQYTHGNTGSALGQDTWTPIAWCIKSFLCYNMHVLYKNNEIVKTSACDTV